MTGAASDFLATMAHGSRLRTENARSQLPARELAARIVDRPPSPRLSLSGQGFDLIAELKLRSPAQGLLKAGSDDLEARVANYARAGAAIVSVLTEPERFDGSLEHLQRASAVLRGLNVPTMRKDFIVDRYQLLEARLAGASGVLLIVRMLGEAQLGDLVAGAAELGLFVLLEAFDAADIDIAARVASRWPGSADECLIGLNSRDLVTLQVVPDRLEALVDLLPRQYPRVAESGLVSADDAARLAASGFTLALVGTALMSAADPVALARAMLAGGRAAGQ
jgi:indole-3-glycerol phosphate synthase